MKKPTPKFVEYLMLGLFCYLFAGFALSAIPLSELVIPTILFFVLAALFPNALDDKKENTPKL